MLWETSGWATGANLKEELIILDTNAIREVPHCYTAAATVLAVIIWRRSHSAAITGNRFISIFSPCTAPQGQTSESRIQDAKNGSGISFLGQATGLTRALWGEGQGKVRQAKITSVEYDTVLSGSQLLQCMVEGLWGLEDTDTVTYGVKILF